MMYEKKSIAILGGTGELGGGLARRWAQAGYRVLIGSRTQAKAAEAVALLCDEAQQGDHAVEVVAMSNRDAAHAADLVVLTVPFASQLETLASVRDVLSGKILVDVTVPLVPPRVARVQLPDEGSAAQRAQSFLGDDVHVVSAFQNVAAYHLKNEATVDCDVLVCGNSVEAREVVIDLVHAAGMRGFHAGSIANSAATEALTSLLIFINKQYKSHTGIRITGLSGD